METKTHTVLLKYLHSRLLPCAVCYECWAPSSTTTTRRPERMHPLGFRTHKLMLGTVEGGNSAGRG